MDEKSNFIGVVQTKSLSFAEACRDFGISRKTGYKWLRRYKAQGIAGLEARSRAPKRRAWAMPDEMASQLLELRRKRPTWGPRKMLAWLQTKNPKTEFPAASTVGDLLKRKGLVVSIPRRRSFPNDAPPNLKKAFAPNDCWCVDFKGHFFINNRRCYPLTVTDNFSRFLLGCDALLTMSVEDARPVFTRIFLEYGLPRTIRSDNGAPFASNGPGGLCPLAVWWLRLGIRLERIPPGKPQHNGRHERMHRTLKAETTRPPESTNRAQQRRFDEWRVDYNTERPHEALKNAVPAKFYRASRRKLPAELSEIKYPGHYDVRRVAEGGHIKLGGKYLWVSQALPGERIGLEEVDDDVWRLYFGRLLLGIVDARLDKLQMMQVPVIDSNSHPVASKLKP